MKKIVILISLLLLVSQSLATELNKIQKINLLNRIGYGVTQTSYENLNKMTYEDWIKQQLYELKSDEELEKKYKFPETNEELFNFYKKYDFSYNEMYLKKSTDQNFYKDTIYKSLNKRILFGLNSENRLREMMVWFWYNHFNTGPYTNTTPAIFLNDYEDKIRKLSLGNFKDLLTMVVHHPAMLVYLNNDTNEKPMKKDAKVGLNENYAREFLELHTMGVGSGYTQSDVQELAKIFSGFSALSFDDNEEDLKNINSYKDLFNYSIKNTPGKIDIQNYFIYHDILHFEGDKLFLGYKIKNSGENEVNEVINILINDSRVAKFISKQLAVYLLSDNPSEKLIDNMSKRFIETKGNISSTLEVLLLSNEYIDSLNNPIKIKDTYTYILSTLKTGLKRNPFNDEIIMNETSKLLIEIEASPYSKNTPEGLSIYGKDWLSSSRLQEYFYYNNLLFRSPEFKSYQINYEMINQLYNLKLSTPEDIILFFTSEKWMKK